MKRTRIKVRYCASLVVCATVWAASAASTRAMELDIKEPDRTEPSVPRKPERERWLWNKQQAEVTSTGDLKWKPEPFVFAPGASIRYVDFDGGDDNNSGASKDAAWKHHPWDAAAGGKARDCNGVQTYVFKCGVLYRGMLHATESGEANNPIQLTSDPTWGKGDAVICGSQTVSNWTRGTDNKLIPDGDKVWVADLDYLPRNLWDVQNGRIERIPLARMPHWKVSNPEDVMSEWWQWNGNGWNDANTIKGKAHLGVDSKHLTRDADYYVNAVVRTEYGICMGTPFPSKVEAFNAAKHAIQFQGVWFGDSQMIITGMRYYLEDKPQYLDTPGEFWFEKKNNNGGRLYLRLPGDRDPAQAQIEVAKHLYLIDSEGMSHVRISGLTFRFTNTNWDLTQVWTANKDVDNAAIRVLGSAEDIQISNCHFEHIAGDAVLIGGAATASRLDGIVVANNDIQYIDHAAVEIGVVHKVNCAIGDVKVLRNHIFMAGMRPSRWSGDFTIFINFPETMEIAGNILERTYGAGIFLAGGKTSGDQHDRPLARNLVFNNRVTQSMLSANDWGGIETTMGGPYYVYNNISGNPNGYWNFSYNSAKENKARLGMAYYLDTSFKNYLFNNVAWGISNDLHSQECNCAAFYEAHPTILNAYFNNTIYRFAMGSNWSPTGGRHLFLGNLWMDVGSWVFLHGPLKEDAKGLQPAEYPHYSVAYGRNVFYNTGKDVAVFEANGRRFNDMPGFNSALREHKFLSDEGNLLAEKSPVRNAAEHDFRLTEGSAAIDHGVRVFVPWALHSVVGEWHFRRNNADPSVLLDEHWYLTPYLVNPDFYYKAPVYNLKVANMKPEDFIQGELEDWTVGALKFNGKDQFASITQDELTKPYTYGVAERNVKKEITVKGKELASADIDSGNLLIEIHFKTEPGHAGSALVSKLTDAGYQLAINKAGGVTFAVKSGDTKTQVASGVIVNDGNWHHVLAEMDRTRNLGTIYVDGRKSAEGKIDLGRGASLSNAGDLLVGKDANEHYFAGTVDFLRIARGTLADAKTTIEELYDWEFDGPFLRDFMGQGKSGVRRDAGAFEYTANQTSMKD